MIVGKAIYHLLTNATDVTDIVNTRIYPEIAQQDADLPYIVYNVANNEPTDTKPEPSKLDTAQVEVNIYSDSYRVVIDLAVAVRAALDRVKGTYAGVNVQSIQYLNEIIDFDEPQRAYNISADYDVRISRTDFEIAQGSPITGVELGELSDVDVDGVTNGQLIAYNSTSGNWEAADDAGGAETIGALNDVSVTTPADREALIYDGGNWVNDNISKTDVGLGNVDNTSDADKPVSSATQTALDAKADTSAVPTELNDLSDVSIAGTPAGNEALIYDTATSSFKSLPNFTNRFEDEAENNKPATPFGERVYTVKADGDGIFIDAQSDTPSSGKVIERKIYHKAGFLESGDVIGDFTLIHTFADDTAYSATTSTFEGFRDGDTYGTPPFTLIQTWEEQTAAPAFTGLLNETYGSGAAAAYSVRRLNGLYTGSAIEVERSSDNTTQDIGFDSNGDLDESALSAFCSGTVCKVRTWYDQATAGGTGSGNDAVQTTHANQPTIYTGGAIVKENGRVALDYDGIESLSATFTSAFSQPNSISAVALAENSEIRGTLSDGYTNRNLLNFANASGIFLMNAGIPQGGSDIRGERREIFAVFNGSSSSAHVDGVQDISGNAGTATLGTRIDLGAGGSATPTNSLHGFIQEWVLWNSDKSTDRTDIESNIGDYFTQNTPLLDTYTGAAAAYSLRKLRSAYSGSAIRVRRSNDNAETDIGFNVFGELDTVSLAAHCGSNNGFVKTWYDQSGSANDATQTNTANQPKIYDGTTGVVTNSNGKPAIQEVNQSGFTETISSGTNAWTISAVFEDITRSSGGFTNVVFGSQRIQPAQADGTVILRISSNASLTGTDDAPNSIIWQHSAGTSEYAINGSTTSTASIGNANFSATIGRVGAADMAEFINEIVLWPSELDDYSGVFTNLNAFYSIT